MEPEGSLPHSQIPATCPYPEPARSSPYPPHPTSWRSILILSSHLRLGLPSGSFPQVSPPKPCIRLSTPPYALHALPISLFSILSPEQYWVSIIIIIIIIESELYEHPVVCMPTTKLRGKRRIKRAKEVRGKFYLKRCGNALFQTSFPSSLKKHSSLKRLAYSRQFTLV